MSCKCQLCGKQYKIDVMIPNDLWEFFVKPKNKPRGSGLICGSCIMKKLEENIGYVAFKLEYLK